MKKMNVAVSVALAISSLNAFADVNKVVGCEAMLVPPQSAVKEVPVIPGMKVASVSDPTRSTGATLFYFPQTANVAFDSRGGSVASVETTLLGDGSYSNNVNGLVFAGGSTMGLAATDGVRDVIFKQQIAAGDAGDFDIIPSVPGAVVYDYGGRIHEGADKYVYPNREMGENLMNNLTDSFQMGRFGAGTTTSVNKVGKEHWGGQGAAFKKYKWGSLFVATALNPSGDVMDGNKSLTKQYSSVSDKKGGLKAGRNTTLSIIVTDVPLNRNQLKRLTVTVHTYMGGLIVPFSTYGDGDIQFAVSLCADANHPDAGETADDDLEYEIAKRASELMKEAVFGAVRTSHEEPQS
jgi:L-aminopeptidase/D-esterase-like protein